MNRVASLDQRPGEGRSERGSQSVPLKVALIAPERDKYSETFIRDQADMLPDRVEFLYGGLPPSTSDAGGAPTYAFVRRLAGSLAVLTGRSSAGLAISLVRRLPGLSATKGLTRYLGASRFDVVLAHYGPTGATMLEPCRAAGIPLVVHFHGYDAYRRDILRTWGERYRALFAYADAVIGVSRNMVVRLEQLGAPPDRVYLQPCGVDLGSFSLPDRRRRGSVCLAVGRFVDKKAPHLTILAFGRAASRIPDAELHMIGDGPLLGACRTLTRALEIEERVKFHGVLPHGEVAAWMRRARVFVQHSVVAPDGDSEGTPVSVLEAAASGLPVVATRHGGIVDAVRDDVTGHLVQEGDVRGMARALERVLSNPDRAERMGRAARDHVERVYDRADAIRHLHDILASAAGASPRG